MPYFTKGIADKLCLLVVLSLASEEITTCYETAGCFFARRFLKRRLVHCPRKRPFSWAQQANSTSLLKRFFLMSRKLVPEINVPIT